MKSLFLLVIEKEYKLKQQWCTILYMMNTSGFKMLFLIAEMFVVNWYFYALLGAVKMSENS